MSTIMQKARSPDGGLVTSQIGSVNLVSLLTKYVALAVLNAMALVIIYAFVNDDNLNLALVILLTTAFANVVTLFSRLFPLRWMAPGLMLMTLFVVYPVIYTIHAAFTNYGDGHLLTKDQAIELIERRQFAPEDAQTYSWTVYQNESGNYALWLTNEGENGDLAAAFAPVGASIVEIDSPPAEPPAIHQGYRQLDAAERAQALPELQNTIFGEGDDTAAIANRRQAARPLMQRFVYDTAQDALIDQQSNTVYKADNEIGAFVPMDGTSEDAIAPGFRVSVGLRNFRKLYEERTLLEPLVDVFAWTVGFSLLSVVTTFAFGLTMALILDSPLVPFRKFWRSLIFIPYAIPGVISVLVWRGMLNQNLGIITNAYFNLFGYRIPWFTDPWMAKFAILLVNLWLGYPYMMLICSGALQAIPADVYEAAAVDGAKSGQTFRKITLPLLLVSVGPLLVASFTYNFNNYVLIEALTQGNPPIPGTSTPAGHTDILISYTYNLAFGSNQGADYGYASAITIVIFGIVGLITLVNFRFVAKWEEVGENV